MATRSLKMVSEVADEGVPPAAGTRSGSRGAVPSGASHGAQPGRRSAPNSKRIVSCEALQQTGHATDGPPGSYVNPA